MRPFRIVAACSDQRTLAALGLRVFRAFGFRVSRALGLRVFRALESEVEALQAFEDLGFRGVLEEHLQGAYQNWTRLAALCWTEALHNIGA